MNLFWQSFLGSLAAAIISLLVFLLGWRLKNKVKRKSHFQIQLTNYSDILVEKFSNLVEVVQDYSTVLKEIERLINERNHTNNDKLEELRKIANKQIFDIQANGRIDYSKIAYLWETKILTSELVEVKMVNGKRKIKKLKHYSSKLLLNTFNELDSFINELDSIAPDYVTNNQIASIYGYLLFLIRELNANIKGYSVREHVAWDFTEEGARFSVKELYEWVKKNEEVSKDDEASESN
ncbi:hypothetical protein [Mycoplasma todarodis]|uniref:Uncharacterized protein n=1 Tax=Mycoplasma todarodis TaxID=1937191 RepID=A0A4R0XMJ0_9MOLU|nr:hypothetical protein [Mycoplasma todarodis]TCG11933.1 hypothetical protein C4B25_00315 [Mycoplasma todarodis]